MNRRMFLAGAAAACLLAAYSEGTQPASAGHTPASHHHHTAAIATAAASRAITYARTQAGKPYLWGGTGPDAFDCSGLVMMAYAAAGIPIPRTSEEQWQQLPHVTTPQPGDLVFFPGSDGTWSSPGHVGLVTGPHTMIQAYAPGTPIGTYQFGTAGALEGTGSGAVVGYARP